MLGPTPTAAGTVDASKYPLGFSSPSKGSAACSGSTLHQRRRCGLVSGHCPRTTPFFKKCRSQIMSLHVREITVFPQISDGARARRFRLVGLGEAVIAVGNIFFRYEAPGQVCKASCDGPKVHSGRNHPNGMGPAPARKRLIELIRQSGRP